MGPQRSLCGPLHILVPREMRTLSREQFLQGDPHPGLGGSLPSPCPLCLCVWAPAETGRSLQIHMCPGSLCFRWALPPGDLYAVERPRFSWVPPLGSCGGGAGRCPSPAMPLSSHSLACLPTPQTVCSTICEVWNQPSFSAFLGTWTSPAAATLVCRALAPWPL